MMSRVASLALLLCGLYCCCSCCAALPETRWRPMLGAPTAIQPTDPGLHTAAAEATRRFNSGLNSRTVYRLDRVTKATRQIVSGLKYIFEADLKSTECLKSEERVVEDCNFHDDDVATPCRPFVFENGPQKRRSQSYPPNDSLDCKIERKLLKAGYSPVSI